MRVIWLRKKTHAEETVRQIAKRLDAFERGCRVVNDWDPETRPHAALAKAIRDYIKEREGI